MREAIGPAAAAGQPPVFVAAGFLALALLGLTATPLRAQDAASAAVVREAWSRATPGGAKVGVGYLLVENRGLSELKLVGAQSDIAGKTELHETVEAGGVARMSPLAAVPVPPGGSVAFAPGGRHVMFMDLKRPLREGERFRARLIFEPGGSVPVEFEVRGIGAGTGAHRHHAH